jgi:DNA-binding CsgD family transcriptional regulator
VLVGRKLERARIDGLLAAAQSGESGALVLRGEAGVGKTALVHHAEAEAARADMLVVGACGSEAERDLAFAALLEVCRPLLGFVEELPERQASGLLGALALGPAVPLDRFTVAAATMGLLAAAAEEQPLLVVVDDAHWIDTPSIEAFAFAARRLKADSVALVFTVRDDGPPLEPLAGLPVLTLDGLSQDEAGELLQRTAPGGVDTSVRLRLVRETRGNPLALVELPRVLTAGQLDGAEPLQHPLPAGEAIERAFAARALHLPEDTRTALLVAALASTDELAVVELAAAELGAGDAALEPAEDAGLVHRQGGRLEFDHPLVRSALVRAARPSQRRRSHRALADALGERGDAERRAWHLAAASPRADEAVAGMLEHAAEVDRERSGYAAAAAAFERAARLTPDPVVRRRRLGAAADASMLAGRLPQARALADEALAGEDEPLARARALHLSARCAALASEHAAAIPGYVEAASLLRAADPDHAAQILADGVESALAIGDVPCALDLADRIEQLELERGSPAAALGKLAIAVALIWAGRTTEGKERAREALPDLELDGHEPRAVLFAGAAAQAVGEHARGRRLIARAIQLARDQDALGILPDALMQASLGELYAGRWAAATIAADEAVTLAEETDQPAIACQALSILARIEAWQGRAESCCEHVAKAVALLGEEERGQAAWVESRVALLEIGLGKLEQATERLDALVRTLAAQPGATTKRVILLCELAEAHVRAAAPERGEEALADARALMGDDDDPSELALVARCEGLLAPDERFEECFVRALAHHARAVDPMAEARTRLCLGERLRRARRRRDARVELRLAIETFERLGAQPWTERARRELTASGEVARRRDPSTAEQLTPHELQIGRAVAEGATNREVAARLFVSPKTIEYHLGRIYRKLGIGSRSELVLRFATDPEWAEMAEAV